MRSFLVIVMCAHVVSAQPATDDNERNPDVAVALSFGTTFAGASLLATGAKLHSTPVGVVGAVMLFAGPTVGHTYGGETWNSALGVRIVTLGTGFAGAYLLATCIDGCGGTGENQALGAALLISSGVAYVSATVYEIASAADVARKHNAHLMVTPTPGGAALSLSGRF
jgi:hypothetical protein